VASQNAFPTGVRRIYFGASVRKTFSSIVEQIIKRDERVVALLGDIGVHSFRESMELFPNRVINIGILEQSMIGIAAGLSKQGLIPFVHTIAPFMVERALEQLKIDFGYQELGGNFVSVGASSDYSALGCTHHCPGDISILLTIPGFELFAPGTANELKQAIESSYANSLPTYYRISEVSNTEDLSNTENKGTLVKKGTKCSVLVFGPMLDKTLDALTDLDVEILYFYKLNPIDEDLIRRNCQSGKVLLIEPFYSGTMTSIVSSLIPKRSKIVTIGYPREFLRNYGTLEEHLEFIGFTEDKIRKAVVNLISIE
jgi:transketolase